jgi:hypothetical protein
MRFEDSFNFIWIDLAINTAIYDSTVLAWKEKVRYQLIRPTSYIKAQLGDSTVNSYRGPSAGPGPIKGKDWESYIRTMPHAEFPSGSSCICRAFANALGVFMDLDLSETIPNGPLVVPISAGSSFAEPGQTPAMDLDLTFNTWNDVVEICGQSRLDAGLHFPAAILAGEELCGFTGIKSGKNMLDLRDGKTPANNVPSTKKILTAEDTRIKNKKCDPGQQQQRAQHQEEDPHCGGHAQQEQEVLSSG